LTAAILTLPTQAAVDEAPFVPKTKAEQRLEYLESLRRPLTDAESEDLRRALHAVYLRNWKAKRKQAEIRALASHQKEERELLAKVEAEARQGEWA